MLVLPTGQILFTDFFFVSVYNPSGTYNPAWAPRIQSAPARVSPGGSYVISGHRFNGMSQGAAYGDDQQSATNYPLVRITNNATGHVFYSRTHDHSSMAVASQRSRIDSFRCASNPGARALASLLSSLMASPPLPSPFRWTEDVDLMITSQTSHAPVKSAEIRALIAFANVALLQIRAELRPSVRKPSKAPAQTVLT